MLSNWLLPPCLVFTKSGTVVSISLTNIAGTTTWTCNLIYDPTCNLIWYFHLKRADECSNLPQSDNWHYWGFGFIQGFDKLVCNIPSVLDSEQVFRAGCCFFCTGLGFCFPLVCLSLNLVQGFFYMIGSENWAGYWFFSETSFALWRTFSQELQHLWSRCTKLRTTDFLYRFRATAW